MPIACIYMPEIGLSVESRGDQRYEGTSLALTHSGGYLQSVSDQARHAGVKPGMTVTGARALCRNLKVLPYNRSLYEEAAQVIWDRIACESSLVEPVSPELCFAVLHGHIEMEQIDTLATAFSRLIGVPAFLGLGSSKLVAEQAARKAGNNPVMQVQAGMEAVFLASVPLRQLPALPPALQTRLERLGIRTLGDVLRLPPKALENQFRGLALLLQRLAVGEDADPVKARWPPAKVESTYSFDHETESAQEVFAGLHDCASRIAPKLRSRQHYCRSVKLTVTFGDAATRCARERLSQATNEPGELFAVALRLLKRMAIERAVIALCLEALGLGTGGAAQLSLLPDCQLVTQATEVERVAALLRQRFGSKAALRASVMVKDRQLSLWTYPLGSRLSESVKVATNKRMEPVRFYRQEPCGTRCHEVLEMQDEWQETAWSWDRLLETNCYRVVTEPHGLHQLERVESQWTLTATAD